MFVLAISRPSSNMGHVGLTSRSPGQILENSCLHSRGNISHRILWSVVVRRCVLWVNIWCLHYRDHICYTIFIKLGQNVCLTTSRPCSNMGHVRSKTRSPGQILGNSCLHSRGHICDQMKLDQNVCLSNI